MRVENFKKNELKKSGGRRFKKKGRGRLDFKKEREKRDSS